jgi:hypothetical protein
MKESKHTPGPWKFERTKTDVEYAKATGQTLADHEGYFRDNDGGWFVNGIAKVFYKGEAKKGYGKPDPEGQANARLISSAPELLECAKAVMDMLKKHGPSIVPHLMDSDENAGQRLRDAIAKAEGK